MSRALEHRLSNAASLSLLLLFLLFFLGFLSNFIPMLAHQGANALHGLFSAGYFNYPLQCLMPDSFRLLRIKEVILKKLLHLLHVLLAFLAHQGLDSRGSHEEFFSLSFVSLSMFIGILNGIADVLDPVGGMVELNLLMVSSGIGYQSKQPMHHLLW